MVDQFSKEIYKCPHCSFQRFMVLGGREVYQGIEWHFFQCPNCHRWMAKKEGEEMSKLFDLPFFPKNVQGTPKESE